jgi:hypothetical protein
MCNLTAHVAECNHRVAEHQWEFSTTLQPHKPSRRYVNSMLYRHLPRATQSTQLRSVTRRRWLHVKPLFQQDLSTLTQHYSSSMGAIAYPISGSEQLMHQSGSQPNPMMVNLYCSKRDLSINPMRVSSTCYRWACGYRISSRRSSISTWRA